MPKIKSNSTVRNDDIDLGAIFVTLWKGRKLIVFGTLGATLLAAIISAIISFFIPKVYRSEAFYQLPKTPITENSGFIGIPIPLFKQTSTQFFNPNRIQIYASQEKSFTAKDLSAIKANFRTAADISRGITPVYAHFKDDTRIVLDLSYDADSPAKAATYVRFLGNYIRDGLTYVTFYDYGKAGFNNTLLALAKKENDIIDAQFNLMLNTKKLLDIKDILKKYPESAKIGNGQLVSVQEDGRHYLSPVTQMVGIESQLADIRQGLAVLQRDKEELTIQKEYFSRCNEELENMDKRGEPVRALLQTVKFEVFKNKDMNQDSIKEVYNQLTSEIQNFEFTFSTGYRFISEPTVPTNPVEPKKGRIVFATFFITLFVLVFWVFTHNWWENIVMVKHPGH